MRNRFHSRGTEAGSVLVIALVMSGIAVLVLGTYLGLAGSRHQNVVRSLAWNHSMAVAEAGIEEGLTQIQYSLTPVNGWTLVNGSNTKTRSQPFGDAMAYY